MKYFILLSLTMITSACTTVRTYDRNGDLIGMCRVSGITKKGGLCMGYANGETGITARTKP